MGYGKDSGIRIEWLWASFMQAGILWNALLDEAESKGSHFVRKWVNSVWL